MELCLPTIADEYLVKKKEKGYAPAGESLSLIAALDGNRNNSI